MTESSFARAGVAVCVLAAVAALVLADWDWFAAAGWTTAGLWALNVSRRAA